MTSNRTQEQALKYAKSLEGKGLDFDSYAGFQCFDLTNYYWNYLFGHGLKGNGAKDIPFWNDFTGEATVIKNVASTLAQPGDVFVYGAHWGGGYGHTGIVLSATLNSITVLEQNYLGGGYDKWEVTTKRTHEYSNPMWFIRPHYKAKATVKSKAKAVVKKTKTKKEKVTKKKIMLVAGHGYNDPGAVGYGTNERDFIRKNIVPNVAKYLRDAGHEVAIYGGSKQSQDMYQDTKYGQQVGNHKDYGLYWVKSQKYDVVVEFHLDSAGASASGGHVIKNAYSADNIDKGLQQALKDTVGTIRGITTRKDLLHCNLAYDLNINYRLIELGFITNKHDMDYITKNLKSFNKKLASAIHGKAIGGAPASKPKPQTRWNWKGTFKPNTAIKVRTSPSLKGKVVSNDVLKFTKVKVIKFNFIVKANGYWWMSYTSKGKTYYSAMCKITDKKERIKHEKAFYGKLKWK
jgi:N-acetylmuramoyl-L-alanine amidase